MSERGGVEKVLAKLANSVKDGNYYEAHQMYHSVCQRYMKQKKISDALQLLHSGAMMLLKYDQVGSAADLAQRMLDIYESEGLAVNDENKNRIYDIFHIFPLGNNNYWDDFLRAALRWSSKFGTCPTGDQQIHHVFGSRCYKEKLYYDAETHFVYGTLDSAKALGHMAYEWSLEGYCTDEGYFIARAVLALLSQKKLQKAHACFVTYTKDVQSASKSSTTATVPFRSLHDPSNPTPTVDLPVFKSRLANFTQVLLYACQREASDVFTTLRGEYREQLAIDGWLYTLVDRVADVWFGLGPKKQPNLIEDLMKNLFGGPPPQANGGSGKPALMEMD
ncbi:hypothetical protein HDV05_003518 [Chytridiales sp. JEL 0842]|nr:hypothetical protein HDV05_003518 [Chytridiales sp. JEL 0842]